MTIHAVPFPPPTPSYAIDMPSIAQSEAAAGGGVVAHSPSPSSTSSLTVGQTPSALLHGPSVRQRAVLQYVSGQRSEVEVGQCQHLFEGKVRSTANIVEGVHGNRPTDYMLRH